MEINNITDELNKLLNDAPGIDGVTATIKANSPTTVINLYESDNQECYHQILGCALLLKGFGNRKGLKFNNITYSVPEIADMDNIRKGSLIYIRDNQIMEVIGILDGMLNLMTDPSHQIISKELADKIINEVASLANTKFIRLIDSPYVTMKCQYDLYDLKFDNIKCKDFINNLIDTLEFIWFITYGKLDEIYDEIVTEFNEEKEKENERK